MPRFPLIFFSRLACCWPAPGQAFGGGTPSIFQSTVGPPCSRMLFTSSGPTYFSPSRYLLKFSANIPPSCCSCRSNWERSFHAVCGISTSDGTPGHASGTLSPNTSVLVILVFSSSPEWMASRMPRVYFRLMREPTPNLPPTHPVLSSHTLTLCFFIFSASICAYFMGCHTRNTLPKQALNVACGSVTPTSVPATCEEGQKPSVLTLEDGQDGGAGEGASQIRRPASWARAPIVQIQHLCTATSHQVARTHRTMRNTRHKPRPAQRYRRM
mmetsp:Transcript_40503/g.120825  ORF Transcript_40503/g.120825 Transcript_40503/m.120825 type:complete len:270 (-) Transcript_40503:1954-2763(-)